MTTTATSAAPILLSLDASNLIGCSSSSECSAPPYYGPVVDVNGAGKSSSSSSQYPVYAVQSVAFVKDCDDNDNDTDDGKSQCSDASSLPQAVASLVVDPLLLPPSATATPMSTPNGPRWFRPWSSSCSSFLSATSQHYVASAATAQPVGYTRPEFVYVRILRPDTTSAIAGSRRILQQQQRAPLGLYLKRSRNGQPFISRIAPDSIFAATNTLCVGDEIVAVNNVSCLHKTAKQVAMFLHEGGHGKEKHQKTLSIIVHHKNGDPNTVSSCIQKPTLEDKVGVWFKNVSGSLIVSRVDNNPQKGLFADTLLGGGHRCIAINDVNTETAGSMPATQAASLIGRCTFVNIVSRPRHDNAAVVLCCERQKDWWTRLAVGFGKTTTALEAMETMT